jgi:hypothetical protein
MEKLEFQVYNPVSGKFDLWIYERTKFRIIRNYKNEKRIKTK